MDKIYLGKPSKKDCIFYDIGPKGGWVPVSKHNYFYIRNYDIYQRWVVNRAFIAKNQPNHVSHSSICAKTGQEACGICKIAKS